MLSLGLSCEEMGYSNEWKTGESPSLIEEIKIGKVLIVRTMCQMWQWSLPYPMIQAMKIPAVHPATDCLLQVPRRRETDLECSLGESRPVIGRPSAFPGTSEAPGDWGTGRPVRYGSDGKRQPSRRKHE